MLGPRPRNLSLPILEVTQSGPERGQTVSNKLSFANRRNWRKSTPGRWLGVDVDHQKQADQSCIYLSNKLGHRSASKTGVSGTKNLRLRTDLRGQTKRSHLISPFLEQLVIARIFVIFQRKLIETLNPKIYHRVILTFFVFSRVFDMSCLMKYRVPIRFYSRLKVSQTSLSAKYAKSQNILVNELSVSENPERS